MKKAKQTIIVKGKQIELLKTEQLDYISLTDIARYKNPHEPKDIIKTGSRQSQPLNFWAFGNKSITPISKGSNSTPL